MARAGRAQGCSEPALPPSPRAVTILGGHLQLPLLPLARGRKAGASSASPPPHPHPHPPGLCISQSRTTTKGDQGRAWCGTTGTEPSWECPGLQPELGTPGTPGPLLCPGHPALGHQSPNYSRAPVPSWLVGSGGAQGTSAPALAQRRLQEHPTGTSHIPRFPPPPTFPYPQHGFGDQISSPPSPAEPEQALPRAVPAWPGCPQPPLGAWCGLLWQPLPKAIAKGCPGPALPRPTLLLFIPGSSQGRDDAAGPVCCRLDE